MLRSTLLLLLPLVITASGCTTDPTTNSQARCEDHPLHAELIATDDATLRVIVTLAHESSDDPATLQDRLLEELKGSQHEIVRRSDNFPILTLLVGEDALCRIVGSTLVASIERDEADPPTT